MARRRRSTRVRRARDRARAGPRRVGLRLGWVDGLVLVPPGVDQPGTGRTERAVERHHLVDVLGPRVTARGRADAHPRHRRKMGAEERHHADLRPRLPPHPLLPDGGDHSRRLARGALDGRRHARGLAHRRLRRGGRRHPPAAAAAGPAQLPAGRLLPQRTRPRAGRPGRGPAGHLLLALGRPARPRSPRSGPRAPERDHQGGGGGLRDPEQHRGGRDRRDRPCGRT